MLVTDQQRQRLGQDWRRQLLPSPRQSASDWCTTHLTLSERVTESPGLISLSRRPWMREPLDRFSDPRCRKITLCWAAQVSKTTTALCGLAYVLARDPGPALWVMPNEKLVKSFSRERLQPLIEDCPALRGECTGAGDDFALLELRFRRMTLALVGANSPTNISSRAIRHLFLDEPDKYRRASQREASAVDLALKRVRGYARSRVLLASTPTTTTGEIWLSFLAGDQRQFQVPCPHCGAFQRLEWKNVVWPADARGDTGWDLARVEGEACYRCAACGGSIGDQHKLAMNERGRWAATQRGEAGHYSYQLPAWYAPLADCRFGRLAVQFLMAKTDPDKLRDFLNSTAAEPFELRGDVADEGQILAHRGDYPPGECPERPAALVLTVDCQQTGFYYVLRGWGRHEASWLVRYGFCETAESLERIAGEPVDLAGAAPGAPPLRPSHVLVDSGSFTDDVYRLCQKNRWLPTKGEDRGQQVQPFRVSRIPQGISILLVQVNYYKQLLQRKLSIGLADPGAWLVHRETGPEYARQLAAEELIERRDAFGRISHVWKRVRRDNHYLDCEVLQLAAAQFLGVRHADPLAAPPAVAPPAPAADPPRRAGPFVRPPESPRPFIRRRR